MFTLIGNERRKKKKKERQSNRDTLAYRQTNNCIFMVANKQTQRPQISLKKIKWML